MEVPITCSLQSGFSAPCLFPASVKSFRAWREQEVAPQQEKNTTTTKKTSCLHFSFMEETKRKLEGATSALVPGELRAGASKLFYFSFLFPGDPLNTSTAPLRSAHLQLLLIKDSVSSCPTSCPPPHPPTFPCSYTLVLQSSLWMIQPPLIFPRLCERP